MNDSDHLCRHKTSSQKDDMKTSSFALCIEFQKVYSPTHSCSSTIFQTIYVVLIRKEGKEKKRKLKMEGEKEK